MLKTALGPTLAVYHPRQPGKWTRALVLASGAVLVVVLFLSGLFQFYTGFTKHGSAAAFSWSWQPLLAAGLIFLAYLIFIIPQLFARPRTISVHKNGLKVCTGNRWLFGPPQECEYFWDQVRGITLDAEAFDRSTARRTGRDINHRVRLQFDNGKSIFLTDTGRGPWVIEHLSDLVSYIKAGLYPRLETKSLELLATGERLKYGPVSVTRDRLYLQPDPFGTIDAPWAEVRRLSVHQGMLVVELQRAGNQVIRKSLSVARIPNLELMLKIIQKLTEG